MVRIWAKTGRKSKPLESSWPDGIFKKRQLTGENSTSFPSPRPFTAASHLKAQFGGSFTDKHR